MLRATSLLLIGTAICGFGLLSARAQDAKKAQKPPIPGGIEGHVKSVDLEKHTLTIVTTSNAERTFNITDETTMLGARGGKVRRGLRDPRFHQGMSLTVVPSGATAKEIHLGYNRREPGGSTAGGKTAGKRGVAAPTARTKADAKKGAMAKDEEDDGEDDEIPGKVKSYTGNRLVVTLLNGTSRTFFLSKNLKVVVRGAVSKQGVADPAIKDGARVVVQVDETGRTVRELHVDPAPPARAKARKAA